VTTPPEETAAKDPSRHIQNIYVEENCLNLPYTQNILRRAAHLPVSIIPDYASPVDMGIYPESLTNGKRHLLLCKNRGKFFKPCPGTKEYHCCDYQVLNIGMNCPMDCVYCILQAYMNNPWLTFFVNVDDLLAELDTAFAANPNQFRRIGTGEFTDSMALDRLTGLSKILVQYMNGKQNAVLELKTKTAMVKNLEGLTHGGNTIVSWSLNSTPIMQKEELRTATLEQRLEAAARCASWGYKLAFHFDPIIYHPGWQEGYKNTIEKLFASVPADKIVWISMGALRYLPNLRQIAAKRFPRSKFFNEEFIIGLDNKYRYFRTLRVELYRFLFEELSRYASPETCIYLCMESSEIWDEVGLPGDPEQLPGMLDKAAGKKGP
jgi:spore photoproduct lyase